jgi:AcrR family transcriptional regulator
MSRTVDHDARRRDLARTAAAVVAREGIDALTFRKVAAEAGASTTILTHYFADKKRLLLATFALGAEQAGARFDDTRTRGGGLRECLESLLPLDAARRDEWRVRTCFWSMAVGDAALAAEEKRHVQSAHRRVEALLREVYPHGDTSTLRTAAKRLTTLVHGLGARCAVDARSWPATEQRRILGQDLAALAATLGRANAV